MEGVSICLPKKRNNKRKNCSIRNSLARKELTALIERATSVSERMQEIASKLKPETGAKPFDELLGEVVEKPGPYGPYDLMALGDCNILSKKISAAGERAKDLRERVAKL